jgi:hypothetical protein
MLKQSSSGMKKVLAVLLIGFFVLPLTAVAASAQGYYAGSNYHTYTTGQPGYITTTDTPAYWDDDVPVFSEPPTGVNTGTIEILNRRRSPGTPEGGSS